jgi:hypothetical protein
VSNYFQLFFDKIDLFIFFFCEKKNDESKFGLGLLMGSKGGNVG